MKLAPEVSRFLSLGWLRSRASRTASWEAHYHAGMLAYREGNLDAARSAYEAALGDAEWFAKGDPRFTASLSSLAGIYRMSGQHALAEPVCLRALAVKEETLGPTHPDVAATLKDLFEIFRAQGNERAADDCYRRALAILEGAMGADFQELSESLDRSEILRKSSPGSSDP